MTESKSGAPKRINYKDVREWLQHVEGFDELKTVSGANWQEDIGTLTALNARGSSPKAVLFDEIEGYPKGFRVLTSTTNTPRRLGLALRVQTDTTTQILDFLAGRFAQWEKMRSKFPVATVTSGPVLENSLAGTDVNVEMFPVPRWHEHDGGRYIGTACTVITRDPDDGWVNAGCYRLMIIDETHVSLWMATPSRHGRRHIEAYHRRGEPAPIAITVGQDPLLAPVLAGLSFAERVSEFEMAGAIAGESLECIEGPETGLPIPAHAEIAFEGWVHEGELCEEGPHGEGLGYYAGGKHTVPSVSVTRIHHRTDPILVGSPPGKPPHDYSYSMCATLSALTRDAMTATGIPGVVRVWSPDVSGRQLQIVSIEQRYFGHVRQAGLLAAQVQPAVYLGRVTIVVDSDIDITNLGEVMWAVVTRADPAQDYLILEKMFGGPIDSLEQTYPSGTMHNSRVLIDACRPFEFKDDFPEVVTPSAEAIEHVTQKFPDFF